MRAKQDAAFEQPQGQSVSDFLLVHGAGQGAKSWGKVWGHMTAPEQHPPPLFRARQSVRVRAVDLPGHGADAAADAGMIDLAEAVKSVVRVAEQENFTDYTLVGHELGGTVALQALSELPRAPRRIVLVCGIVPAPGQPAVSVYPTPVRLIVRTCKTMGALIGRDIPAPAERRSIVTAVADLEPMDRVQTIGHFGPLPLRMLTEPVNLSLDSLPCPVTYVVLTDDRLISASRQQTMAGRIPGATVVQLDSGHQVTVQRPRELAETLLAA